MINASIHEIVSRVQEIKKIYITSQLILFIFLCFFFFVFMTETRHDILSEIYRETINNT